MSLKIVIDDAVPFAKEIFGHLGEIILMPGKAIDAKSVKDADALVIRSRTQINQALLDNSKVKFVGSTVVGLDHVDQTYLQQADIGFYSAQGCNANSVAEFVINALFEVAQAKSFELKNKTLGIIGVGNVGSRLLNKAQALGMTCLVNDPPKQTLEPTAYNYVDLDTALQADIISVHTPLTFDGEHPTYQLLDAEKLSTLVPQQILVNAARGGIINETAWAQTPTLANIIDCWENEPNIDQALYQTAFFATPHIAGHSFDAKLAGSTMVYQALCRFFEHSEQNHWQNKLPKPPASFAFSATELNEACEQQLMQTLLRHCHSIHDDDHGIRGTTHEETQQKYEFFRRNYPVYREWHCHFIKPTGRVTFDNLLKSLNFQSE